MSKPLTIDDIKKALLPAIADLFEGHSVKTDKKFGEMDRKFQKVDQRLDQMNQKIEHGNREIRVLLEQQDTKIEAAIEFSRKAMENTSVIKDHSKRIKRLETEVDVIKKVIKSV